MALIRNSNLPVYVVWNRRNLLGIISSFRKRNVQKQKSTIATIFYYAVITTFSWLVTLRVNKHMLVKVKHEEFLRDPQATIRRVSKMLEIDSQILCERIQKNKALQIGPLFNGNRIIFCDQIYLNRI